MGEKNAHPVVSVSWLLRRKGPYREGGKGEQVPSGRRSRVLTG